ncbi:2-amino-4-hydroxy-6-hydroxymethyldihydropteridine diphosphokinase [Mucilaginibacter sp.]
MNIIYLLLGSNLGNRQMFLNEAVRCIAADIGKVTLQSAVYETQAWGNTTTPDYLNQVIEVQSWLSPRELLQQALAIEQQLGRERHEKWEARVIDIDILFYNHEIIDEPDLVIPHPHLHKRKFTLMPMAEINPDLIHPVMKKNILWLNAHLADGLIVKKL